MKKTTKIFGLLLTLFGLALVTGCNLLTNALNENIYSITIPEFENGAVSVNEKYVLAGVTVELTAIPKDGYKLENITVNDGNVSLSGDGNTRVFKMPECDVVVNASFIEDKSEPNPVEETTYIVTFKDGDITVESKSVKSGEKVTRPTNPTKAAIESETYTFDGWHTSDDNGTTLSEAAFDFDTAITDNITLYAKWAVNAVTHTVTFDTNGGSTAPEVQTIIYGNKATKPADPTRDEINNERYSFAYWYTLNNNVETEFNFNTEITSDITLYAKWTIIALYSITITSSANGAVTASKTSKIEKGERITLTITPNNGYELEEIIVNGNPITGNTFDMPAGNVTVIATFKLIKYKVTYAAYTENGVNVQPKRAYDYFAPGESIELEVNIPGSENVAYVKYSGTMGNADITLEPELWFKAEAPVKFFLDDTELFINDPSDNVAIFNYSNGTISLANSASKNELFNSFKEGNISLYGVSISGDRQFILVEGTNEVGTKCSFNRIELVDNALGVYFSKPTKALRK